MKTLSLTFIDNAAESMIDSIKSLDLPSSLVCLNIDVTICSSRQCTGIWSGLLVALADRTLFPVLVNCAIHLHAFDCKNSTQMQEMLGLQQTLINMTQLSSLRVMVSCKEHISFCGRYSPFPYDQYRK